MKNIATLDISAMDVTGQNVVNVTSLDRAMSVGELLESLVPKMRLPLLGNGGRRLTYHARHDRTGRHLHASELLGDSGLEDKDRITVQPSIQAGGRGFQ